VVETTNQNPTEITSFVTNSHGHDCKQWEISAFLRNETPRFFKPLWKHQKSGFFTTKHAIFQWWMVVEATNIGILVLQSDPNAPWYWYIYLQNWVIYGVNVGKYSSTTEHMGESIQIDELQMMTCSKFEMVLFKNGGIVLFMAGKMILNHRGTVFLLDELIT